MVYRPDWHHCLLAYIIFNENVFRIYFFTWFMSYFICYIFVWFSSGLFCFRFIEILGICEFIDLYLFGKILDIISSNSPSCFRNFSYVYVGSLDVISSALFVAFIFILIFYFFLFFFRQWLLLSSPNLSFCNVQSFDCFFSSLCFTFSCFFTFLFIFYWIWDMVNFSFLDAGYFSSILLNILALFSGMLLGYSQTFWSF